MHTFDSTKATQELRDGVAVTVAFGKAAYKWAGDKADDLMKAARNQCPTSPPACEEAARWGEGGRYRTALHMAVGGMSFGTTGAAGPLAAGPINYAIERLGITDSGAISALQTLAVAMAGAAGGGTAGAVAAFNADTNNRQPTTAR